jgi:outer membrane protein OmpA-like peptidoglycan-associated protein
VAREQSREQRKNLVAIWKAIVAAAGGELIVEEKPLTRDPADGLPTVTPVPLGAATVCVEGAIELTGADVAFRPNSAEFVDGAAARAVLEPIAEQLVTTGATATLTGTTANVGDPSGQEDLSRKRAQAVLDVLVDLGVPAANLTAVGLGSEFPGYVQDHDAAGTLLPGPAAQNRKVIVQVSGGTGVLTCA